MADSTQTQQPNVLNDLLTGGLSKQTQDQTSAGIQALMGLLQPTSDPQTANASLGPSTTNVLNNAANLSGNPNMAAGNYDATQNTGINQQQAIQTLQGLTKNMGGVSNQPNAYQKGVNRTLQAAGEAHSAQAIQAGVDPNDIANHPAMQPNGQQVQDPTGQPNSQPIVQPSNQPASQPTDINTQIDNINKQTSLNIAKRNLSMSQPPNFWQRFGQNFAKQTGGITNADTLANLTAGQKIAGQEPLQPKDIGELNAGSYKAALEATGTALTATQQKLTALTDLYGKEEQNKGLVASALHNESPNQAVLRTAITNTADNMATHVKNFRDLIANRPTFNAQGLNTQTADIVNKTQQAKVGKYTLVKSSK